jgi:hypothetical protein
MHLSIARHICGGELAEVKISFSDAVAACGMETDASTCVTHEKATSNCCRNEITKLSVDDYFGASPMQLKEVTQPLTVLFFLPLIQSLYSIEPEVQAFTDIGTQANITIHEVCLPKICVFRI